MPFPFLSRKTSENTRFVAWGTVASLWVVAALNYLDRQVLVNMHDAIVRDIPMSEERFGDLSMVFLVVYGLASPLGGWLADRYGRRTVILASLALWSFATWWTGHVGSYGELLAARAAMGLGEACYIPAGLALIADRHASGTRALATGLHMSGVYVGKILGGLGGFFAVWIGWRDTFTALGAAGVVYALFLAATLTDAPAPVSGETKKTAGAPDVSGLGALLRDARFLALLAVVALAGSCNWLVMSWLPKFMQDTYSLTPGAAGFHAGTWINVTMFAAVIGGGIFSDRLSRRSRSARVLIPAAGFLLAVPGIWLGSVSPTLAGAAIGFATYGVAQGFLDANLMPALREVAPGRLSATGYGVLNFTSCLAGGLMVKFAGRMLDASAGFTPVFRLAAGGLVAAAVLLLAMRSRFASGQPG